MQSIILGREGLAYEIVTYNSPAVWYIAGQYNRKSPPTTKIILLKFLLGTR